MEASAGAIPEPPEPFKTDGTDPLSQALLDKTRQVEAPFIEGIGKTKADAQETARRVQAAADRYEQSDRNIAGNLQASTGQFDASASTSGTGQNGLQGLQQLQQMTQAPMQAVQAAAQIPAQLAQMAGQVPQAVMQGVQPFGQMGSGLMQNMPGSTAPQSGNTAEQSKDGNKENDERPQPEGAGASPATSQQAPTFPQSPVQGTSSPEAAQSEGRPNNNGTGSRTVPSDPAIVL
ncbi:hypothetical protein KL864_17720 [Mycolicibacterium goodii]|uniref:hypothetical protein n=1 Tax=Mycolicibacterium goodii TaxID=134601 RepID=UPI001BDD7509|nr:hypothetical protein [Mycolicibacterium goodii]MBU8817740.1 hypothetical protein [Mycolicibacterium goodii]